MGKKVRHNETEKLLGYLPPKNPVETYPEEGPPPRTIIKNVTIHPDLQSTRDNQVVDTKKSYLRL